MKLGYEVGFDSKLNYSMIAHSSRASKPKFVVVGSNPSQANFL